MLGLAIPNARITIPDAWIDYPQCRHYKKPGLSLQRLVMNIIFFSHFKRRQLVDRVDSKML